MSEKLIPAGGGSITSSPLTTGNILVGVAGTSTSTQGLNLVSGASGSASPAAGKIGYNLKASASASVTPGAQASVVALTLTAGIWSVNAAAQHDNNVGVTGCNNYLYTKGANTTTFADDYLYTRVAPAGSSTFAARVVVVASGDADKTIEIKSQTVGATGDVYGFISATIVA